MSSKTFLFPEEEQMAAKRGHAAKARAGPKTQLPNTKTKILHLDEISDMLAGAVLPMVPPGWWQGHRPFP